MAGVTSHTRVQVTVEIDGSSYGEEWKLSDLIRQSSTEAVQYLRNHLASHAIKIIGEPKVLTVTHIQKP